VATFVEAGGQKINEITADTTYAMQNVDFNATAKQGARARSLRVPCDSSRPPQCASQPGVPFGDDSVGDRGGQRSDGPLRSGRIEVNNVRLVSGDQSIAADASSARTARRCAWTRATSTWQVSEPAAGRPADDRPVHGNRDRVGPTARRACRRFHAVAWRVPRLHVRVVRRNRSTTRSGA
jgi:hypothetical protein